MAAALTTGINTYYLIQYLEDISELDIGIGDEVDINQTLVLQFIKEGYQRVISLYDRWPWFQSIYTFNTVNNQRGYSTGFTLTNTTSTAITTPVSATYASIAQIINLVNNTNGGNDLKVLLIGLCGQGKLTYGLSLMMFMLLQCVVIEFQA